MKRFPATKARLVLRALLRIGWVIIRQVGSHRILAKEGYEDYIFAYHDSEELSPVTLRRIAKNTGLRPEDL